jgi:hypothetical protein
MKLYGAASEPGACSLAAFKGSDSADSSCGGGDQTARFGCYMCLRVARDSSLENLANHDLQYSYLKPLNNFRNYIQDTHYDPSKRNWVSRTIDKDGQITISPNAYSPQHCEDLLRLAVSVDVQEEREAAKENISPRFTIITRERLVAIELYWQRY